MREKSTGESIKEARKSAGMTQAELAEKLHVSPQNISQYERGVKKPKVETLKRIADAIGVDVYSISDFDFASEIIADSMNRHFDEFGECAPAVLQIAESMRGLNPTGQAVAVARVEELTKIEDYTKK